MTGKLLHVLFCRRIISYGLPPAHFAELERAMHQNTTQGFVLEELALLRTPLSRSTRCRRASNPALGLQGLQGGQASHFVILAFPAFALKAPSAVSQRQ